MEDVRLADLSEAIQDFNRARRQAQLKTLLRRLSGAPHRLLAYDEVRRMLRLRGGVERGVQDIPLEAIVGSVGRYNDFSRDFLPLRDANRYRWSRLRALAMGMRGFPPIEVYKIGNAYFVRDGNHRVSVARRLGARHIQAYVTELPSRVPLEPDMRLETLILMAEYADFLEKTRLDQLRPGADLRLTEAGQYPLLLEHIEVHRYFMGLDFQRPIPYEEAVTHWYDTVYLPVVEAIRQEGLLRYFPGRSEADLYLWLAEHRAQLEQELGLPVRPRYAARYILANQRRSLGRLLERVGGRLARRLLASKGTLVTEAGPIQAAGERLFQEVLTPINGKEDGWCALEQAIRLAQREAATLYGLHVVTEGEAKSATQEALETEFEQRCARGGVAGKLLFAEGDVVEQTCRRAVASDLVVVNLSYPPPEEPLGRLASGFRELIARCPRPVLATPQQVSPLNSALLAFDGSPKAREALYLATYLAGRWGIALDVLTVADDKQKGRSLLEEARHYAEAHGVMAGYHLRRGPVAATIMEVAKERGCDFLILGGYGLSPVLELMLGSTVDDLLRARAYPLLICR